MAGRGGATGGRNGAAAGRNGAAAGRNGAAAGPDGAYAKAGPGSRWRQGLVALAWLAGLTLLYVVVKYVVPYFASFVGGLTTPFVIALVLAILIDSTVNALEDRLHLPRGWAVAVALGLFLVLATGFLLFGVGAVVVQLGQLSIDLPAQYSRLVTFAEGLLADVSSAFRGLPADLMSVVETSVRSGLQSVYVGLSALVQAFLRGVAALPSAFLIGIISLVATFFFSRDKELIGEFCLSLLPERQRERVVRINRDVVSSAVGLVKAQLVLVGITLLIILAGLYVLRVRYAWLVGLLAGLLDVLPAVGPATILVPWSIYCFIDGNVGLGAGLLVLAGVVAVFRQIMEPRIVGQKIGLHPLITLLALFAGVKILGAVGLIVGPLAAIIIKAVIRSGIAPPPVRARRGRGGTPVAGEPGAANPAGPGIAK